MRPSDRWCAARASLIPTTSTRRQDYGKRRKDPSSGRATWSKARTPLQKVAEVIAGEQSSGTVPGAAGRDRRASGAPARASRGSIRCRRASGLAAQRLRGAARPLGRVPPRRGRDRLPGGQRRRQPAALMATVAGNLFELGEVTGLRLLDLDLPDAYARGVPGTAVRRRRDPGKGRRAGRPLIGTIIKPSIGLTPRSRRRARRLVCTAASTSSRTTS